MLCEYTLQIVCSCPVDKLPDVYTLLVRTHRPIPVEEILKAVAEATETRLYQEALTEKLHRLLAAEVETVGSHSGVRTRCVCG